MEQLAGPVSPGEGQGQEAQQLAEAFRVDEVGVLEVEPPAFQAAKQGFDLPAVGIGADGLGLGGARTGDEQKLAVVQAQRGEVHEAAPDRAAAGQVPAFAGLQRAEQRVEAQHPVPTVGYPGVALEALVERDAPALQPEEPVLADKLAVGQQGGDFGRAEDGKEALHQGDALGGVGVARLAQDRPEHRQGNAPVGDAEHQEVDVRLAELPVRAVHGQPPGAVADRDEADQQAGQAVVVEVERAEEPLQALVVGIDLGLAAEPGRQLRQVDAAHLEQGQQELGEEGDPRPVPGQVFGKDGFEFVSRVFREGSHRAKKIG